VTDAPVERPLFRPAPRALQRQVDHAIEALQRSSSGDRAALRKLRPNALHQPAFWKIAAGPLQDALPSPEAPWRAREEQRWAVILAAAASALHSPSVRLGAALARAGVAEVRLTRLLRARGEQLPDAVRVLAHQLERGGVAFDLGDLAWLVLSEDRDDEDRARQQLARDYYGAVGADT
jgi:CRISPR system Cascade subunit CasB